MRPIEAQDHFKQKAIAGQSETDLLDMLNASADGIARIDRSWTVVYLNARAREIVAGAGQVIGRNHWECFPSMVYDGSPWLRHYRLAMDQGTTSDFTEYYPEPLNLWVRVEVKPFRDGIIAFFRNVTAEKDLEQQRDAYGKRLEQVLQVTDDGIAYIDRSWRITYLNDRGKDLLSPSGDVLGRNLWEAFPAALDAGPLVAAYHRAMEERIGCRFEFHYPEPLDRWFQVICEPAEEGIIAFFRDVTEQKHAHHNLIQTEKLAAVGRLSASIAHEINNPLESVTNLLYLARTSQEHQETQEYLTSAERELRRVSAITSQTLRFYKQSTNATVVTCEDLFETVLPIYQGRLLNCHVVVEKRTRASRSIECFEGEIRQIVNNIVGNAIDAMHPAGGRLLLRSRDGHNWRTGQPGIVLTIADTGVGIPKQLLAKIFEAFFTSKGIGGTGLGLWVSRVITDRHHGALHVRSSQKEPANGTVFTLFLPFDAVSR